MLKIIFPLGLIIFLVGCYGSGDGGSIPSPLSWSQITIMETSADFNTSSGGYIILSDFDKDNDLDAAVGFASDQRVEIFIQGGPTSWVRGLAADALGAINSLDSADLDESGNPDIVAASGNGNVWILLSPSFSGAMGSWSKSSLTNPISVSVWNDARIGQLDDESQFEIAAVSSGSGVIAVWRASGAVSSASAYQGYVIHTFSSGGFERLVIADIDKDGDNDLVACGAGGLIWLENPGGVNITGTWTPHLINSSLGFTRVAASDMDNDDDIDVVVTQRTAGKVLWYENSGSPRTDPWSEHTLADLSPGKPDALSLCDLDNDTVTDVLVGTDTVNQGIYWLYQVGDPRASRQIRTIATTSYDVGELPSGDIDGSGRTDFATTLIGSDIPIVWYKQE
jgi:hypothetical protein